ncbi:hypothetical protein [Labedaea rhizosphaerae]|uniref:Uncharacterized protein n=1 Tax=Labedaea rhizosphaerae TaxID=598644 RepID=A0A4R6S9R8_LABRH|nr:hypothetical protein [Labedaea rhizosphaerae]TDP96213.1 hypothetical protein EV186_104195 [Labedaea rhizosphaerae]
MDIAAQVVTTSWTKRSRGAPAADRRNAAPISFPLPDVTLPVLHEVMMDECSDFEPREQATHSVPDASIVTLKLVNAQLRVQATASPWGSVRRRHRPPAVNLTLGSWVRWMLNYRLVDTSTGEWSYRAETLNLAYGPVGADVFLGEPTHLVDERMSLF